MIRVEGLTKRYDTTTVVDDVSFEVERNSITVVVGTSGSGKSTLLRMINRLVEPSAAACSSMAPTRAASPRTCCAGASDT